MNNPFLALDQRLSVIEELLIEIKHGGIRIQPPADERLTRQQVSNLYHMSLPTLHECMKRGLPYEKVGRKTLFRREDVDRYFQNK